MVVGRFRFGSSINRCWLGSPVRCRAGPLTFVHNLARRRLATQEPPSIHHHCGPTAETRDRRACYSPPAVPRNSNFLISSEPLPLLTVRPPSRGTSYPSSRRRRRRLSRSLPGPSAAGCHCRHHVQQCDREYVVYFHSFSLLCTRCLVRARCYVCVCSSCLCPILRSALVRSSFAVCNTVRSACAYGAFCSRRLVQPASRLSFKSCAGF